MEHASPQTADTDHVYQFRVPEMAVAIVRELFVMLFCTYFATMAIDALADSFVSNVFDTDLLLWVLLVVGVLTVLLQPLARPADSVARSMKTRYATSIIAGVLAGAVVWTKMHTLGSLGVVYALASAVIVAIISYLLLNENESTDHSTP